jgi:outer membrane protein TolC
MVFMRVFHRRCLVTVGLGAAIACSPIVPSVASDPAELTETELVAPQNLAEGEIVPLEESPAGVAEPSVDASLEGDALAPSANPEAALPDPETPDAAATGAESNDAVAEDGTSQAEAADGEISQAEDIPETDSSNPVSQPLDSDDAVVTPTLEPGEEPVPLTEAELDEITEAASRTEPTSSETEAASSEPFDQILVDGVVTEPVIPPTEGLTDQGFEGIPDYLIPDPNPLLTPTQPDEVEIVGTQPLSLETAIELAYRNSEDVQIAQYQYNQSLAALREARAALYPTVDLSAGVQVTNSASSRGARLNIDETFSVATGSVNAQYDLGLSGERGARIRAAESQVRLAELALEQTQADLRLDTTNNYYAVQQAIADIRINEAFLEEAERNLEDTQLREEVGVGTRFDVLRADVQVANARQQLTQARSQRQIAQRQLARLLNVPPSINITTLAVEISGAWPLTLEETIVLAYQNRAEMESFLVQRELNEEQRQVALSQQRPNLGLFAQYELQDVLSGETNGGPLDDGFALGAQLTWLLFDGGATQARAAQSEQDIRIDESEFESIRNDIRLQVEEAYYTLLANRENIDTAKLAVDQAKEALYLANLRFEAGVGTQLDVLSATSELTQARGNLVAAVLDYNRALARLQRSVSNMADGSGGDALQSVVEPAAPTNADNDGAEAEAIAPEPVVEAMDDSAANAVETDTVQAETTETETVEIDADSTDADSGVEAAETAPGADALSL